MYELIYPIFGAVACLILYVGISTSVIQFLNKRKED